jgi:phosphonate degradation associated HDIG domain protein
MATIADEVVAIFGAKGESAYYGEDVSQLEHALQAAQCAERDNAAPSLIVAALVHDIGHLLEDIPEDTADHGIDAKHEEIGQHWLAARFARNVYEPVHLHVAAKRYLCATDPAYLGKLSAASVQSLALQGGPMTPGEVLEFERNEFYRDAISLRRWDDEAKIPGLTTLALHEYRDLLNSVAQASA